MNAKLKVLLSVLCLTLSAGLATADAQSYVIVVHSSNEYEADTDTMKATIRNLHLKNTTAWPNGGSGKAQAFSPRKGTPVYEAYINEVLGMSEAELAQHWLATKQKNGSTPPRSVPSAAMLAKFIDRYPSGFGVLTKEETSAHSSSLRILLEF